jgi:ABC-type oligopeptide transport system ATPase subunit
MVSHFILLVGGPGCGKTFYGNNLHQKLGPTSYFIDDIEDLEEIKEVERHSTIIIADPHLCNEKIRNKAVMWLKKNYGDVVVDFVFFENNEEQCRKNVELRRQQGDNRKVEASIRRFAKIYQVPPGHIPIPVWRP